MSKWESYVLQNKTELASFIRLLQSEGVKSYLEIGCKFGGSLWPIANALPKGSRVVAVELPHGDKSFKENLPHLQQCCALLKQRGYDVTLIVGDSTDAKVVEQVYALGPYDAVFIDANHTLDYVRADWANYGKIGKLIAFHDIGFFRAGGQKPGKKPIEVPIVWKELKQLHRHLEIRHDINDNGIGVLWPS